MKRREIHETTLKVFFEMTSLQGGIEINVTLRRFFKTGHKSRFKAMSDVSLSKTMRFGFAN